MVRVVALVLVISLASFASALNTSWLERVTTPPAEITVPEKHLTPLLTSGSAAWPLRRNEIKEAWRKILGPLPQPPKGPILIEELADESLSTCTRKLVRYEAEPRRFVRAYILRPSGDELTTRPGVVVFHPTSNDTIKVVAGTGGRTDRDLGLRLVERGVICICPENFIYEQDSWKASVAEARKRHPDSTGMATMLADGLRATDVLLTLPGVDKNRIGSAGHSLGAKESLYHMAFDDRVKAGISSEGGIPLEASNWYADWYLGAQIKKPDFDRDHHELLALIAPRPFLIFGGETGRAADGNRTWPYVIAANELSKQVGHTPGIGFINHGEDHSFHLPQVEKALDWMEAWLSHTSSKIDQ